MDPRRLKSPTGTTLTSLEKSVFMALKPWREKLQGKSLLVGVSGGPDSVFLLQILLKLKSRFHWTVAVAHVDHGVRGPESKKDALFVQKLAAEQDVLFFQKKLKVPKSASENLLRQHRYSFFRDLLKTRGFDLIVTAHHGDDLLETRLMRLIQGVGVEGLKAMTVLDLQQRLFRPLLSLTKEQILAELKSQGQKYRKDRTNSDIKKLRNWIRKRWLGVLRTDHPEKVGVLARSLTLLGDANTLKGERGLKELDRSVENDTNAAYNFLRNHARGRVTENHVLEFLKRIKSPRKSFQFRLAGTVFKVEKQKVIPIP